MSTVHVPMSVADLAARSNNADESLRLLLILQGVKRGSHASLAELYDQFSGLIFSVALRVLRDHGGAEDVLQDVFIQIWRCPDPFLIAHGNMAGWLTVVARNKAVDVFRKRRRERPLEIFDISSDTNLLHDSELLLMSERAHFISGSLPRQQREALDMAFWRGMTHSEISELTGTPIGTVKTRIRAALLFLRKGLEEKSKIVPRRQHGGLLLKSGSSQKSPPPKLAVGQKARLCG